MKQTIELNKRWKDNPSKGEVFTPSKLVCEMLDKIPTSVWKNPNSMFLDPCMGKGTFLIEIVTRLINIYGYSKEDSISRVYGYDTCVKYVNHLKRGGLTNIFHKDFLNEELNMKFDVIVGNPPYQINDKNSNKKAEKLWTKFISKSYDLLNNNGYLSLVTPTSWLSGSKNIKKGSYGVMDLFKENNLISIGKGFIFPNVSISTHYWILKKDKNYQSTEVIDSISGETFNINIGDGFYPSDLNKIKTNIIQKVFSKESFEWIPATSMYTKWRKEATNEETEINNVKTYVKGGNFENTQYAYFKQECKPELNSIKKVIVPLSGAEKFSPYIDIEGKPFCCDSYVFPIKENDVTVESVSSVFYSKLFKFLIQNYRTSGFIQYAVVKKLPKFNLSKVWTDEEIFNYIELTNEEIKFINENL